MKLIEIQNMKHGEWYLIHSNPPEPFTKQIGKFDHNIINEFNYIQAHFSIIHDLKFKTGICVNKPGTRHELNFIFYEKENVKFMQRAIIRRTIFEKREMGFDVDIYF